ncbi:MAG: glycoside hydrolase, partial [Acidobacteria bacterium]|nr:glycoside hydrolase [Acidobacteriota bacterium]
MLRGPALPASRRAPGRLPAPVLPLALLPLPAPVPPLALLPLPAPVPLPASAPAPFPPPPGVPRRRGTVPPSLRAAAR